MRIRSLCKLCLPDISTCDKLYLTLLRALGRWVVSEIQREGESEGEGEGEGESVDVKAKSEHKSVVKQKLRQP